MAKKPKDLPSLDADVTEVKDGVATTSFSDAFSNLTVSAQKEENLPTVTEQPKKTGRPSKYTKEIAQQICEQLSEGIPLREICRKEGFPAWRTVYDWMYRDEDLSAAIAHARDVGYDALAEQCLEIADNIKLGKRTTYSSGAEDDEDSVTVVEEDMLGHRKLQIETRLKLLAKFNPKKYGDAITHKGDAENPLEAGTNILHQFILKLENKSATLDAQRNS
jgi:hypothetical protein